MRRRIKNIVGISLGADLRRRGTTTAGGGGRTSSKRVGHRQNHFKNFYTGETADKLVFGDRRRRNSHCGPFSRQSSRFSKFGSCRILPAPSTHCHSRAGTGGSVQFAGGRFRKSIGSVG